MASDSGKLTDPFPGRTIIVPDVATSPGKLRTFGMGITETPTLTWELSGAINKFN